MIFLGCLLLSACSDREEKTYLPEFSTTPPIMDTEYIFGVHPLHNPQRLFEVFGPMMEYLSKNITGTSFRLEASRNYAAFDEKLYARKFHFALPNPFQTVNAVDKGYKVFGKMGDDQNFRGIILVRKDSGIKKVTDLKGKAVSYPAPTALAASMMPQYYLQTHGVDVMTELDNRYVGSQESSIMNVFLGQTQAAATWPPPWKALSAERPELAEQLKVIWRTEPLLNNGLVVLPDVPDNIIRQVIKLLTTLHTHEQGRRILKPMELSGYESADDDTYLPVRDFLIKFTHEVRPLQ
ncbi:phosphonate transport system substrate-binding protein [Candidatus Electrothrix marina]|uniref:Phosphonate transport system substrate-binding protein n=3 Tax=Candidatus Electrothrix marina TaxID=1859130 RepID=A0A444JGP7_9BACT|nr:phosphonate transport system substrate-binding protein [Candidatus Electrothrix marina]